MKSVLEQARMLGCIVVTNTSEAGQQVSIAHLGEDRRWSMFVQWGDEPAAEHRLRLWLNTIPWPAEDDPRVENEGAYA